MIPFEDAATASSTVLVNQASKFTPLLMRRIPDQEDRGGEQIPQ